MNKCWASSLGDCEGKITREHLISKGLFLDDTIIVKGYSWCKDETIKVSLASLTSKILCKKHNSLLSEIDRAGIHSFNILQKVEKISKVREKIRPKRWNVVKDEINGKKLERWFLKTLINLSYHKEYIIGIENHNLRSISNELVEICFGLRKPEKFVGLYNAVFEGQRIYNSNSVNFCPLIKDKKIIIGGMFAFRGFNFVLSLISDLLPGNFLSEISGDIHTDWFNSGVHYHLDRYEFKIGRYLSHLIKINW